MAEQGDKMAQNLDYALGSLDARVTLLERGFKDMQREIRDELRSVGAKSDVQNDKIDKLIQTGISDRASRKAIAWFVGIIATVSTVLLTLHQIGWIR